MMLTMDIQLRTVGKAKILYEMGRQRWRSQPEIRTHEGPLLWSYQKCSHKKQGMARRVLAQNLGQWYTSPNSLMK